jgi:hypothetical protein
MTSIGHLARQLYGIDPEIRVHAIWFEGNPPHDKANSFSCLQNTLWWVD